MEKYYEVGVRNRTPMETVGILESYRRPILGTECTIKRALEVEEGVGTHLCYGIEDRARVRVLMEKELREGTYTQGFFDTLDKTYKATVQDIKKFWKHDHAKASVEELIECFDRYNQIYITTLHPMVIAIYASDLQDLFEAELGRLLRSEENTREKKIEYTALLLTPTRLTTVQKEEQLLCELQGLFAQRFPQGGAVEYEQFCQTADIQEKFRSLVDGCGWFHMEYIGEPRIVEDYKKQVWERAQDLKNANVDWKDETSPNERLALTIVAQREFLDSHDAPEFFRSLLFAMQEFLIVLDYTKADLIEGIYYARPLLEEIGQRVGLSSWVDVRFLMPGEIREFMRAGKKVDAAYIADRKRYFTAELKDDKITYYFGDEAKKVAEFLLPREEVVQVNEFTGMTAYPGNIRGKATIVTGAHDRDKFKHGDIMVTRDTTTELTSIIKMASAIVADNGSLLSHTAIVSREFKIPCLVQTKFGTKVVKDGDEIEVDATNGIVRILKTA